MKTKKKVLACAVLLSLMGGHNCAAAAGIDATERVTASGGPYNTITVAGDASETLYGIYKSDYDHLEVSLDGEQKITVKNTVNKENSNDVVGVHNVTLTANEEAKPITLDLEVSSTKDAGLYGVQALSSNVDTQKFNTTITGALSIKGRATSDTDTGTAWGVYARNNAQNTITDNLTLDLAASGEEADVKGLSASGWSGVPTNNARNEIGGDLKLTAVATRLSGAEEVQSKAFGLYAENYGMNTIKGNTIINVTAQGGGSYVLNSAIARGLAASSNGVNTITGNVRIIAKGEGGAFSAYSMWAAGSGKNNLSSTGKVKQLEGDVLAGGGGENLLTLDTAASYLQGNIINNGGTNTVIVASGATWRPVYDNRYGTEGNDQASGTDATLKFDALSADALTLKDGGLVDLTWDGWNKAHTEYDTAHTNRLDNDYRTLTIDKLSGDGGIFRLDSDLANAKADKVTLGADSTATNVKIQINYDAFYDKKAENLTGSVVVVEAGSETITVTGGESIYNENTFLATVAKEEGTNNWLLTGLTNKTGAAGANINTKTAADSRYTLNSLWLAETNSLHKRVGDLRLEKITAEGLAHRDGLWAKYGHGTLQNGSGSTAELQYNQFQIGYDKAFTMAGGQVYRGVTLSRITGDTAYAGGSGEASSTTLGLYQAWLDDTGHYYDVVLKHGKLTNDYKVVTSADSGDYSAWGTTLSGEYGYRQALSHGAYFEPQAEVILGHVGGADYTTAKGMQVKLDSTNHAIARLGFALGQEFAGGNAFVQANYYHDFAGGGGVTTGVVGYEREQAKNWYELGLGGTVQLSDSTNAYAEINKYFGDTKSNLIFNVGMRYSF